MHRAGRIAIPSTAFSLGRGKKRPRKEDVDHLAFIRSLPCLATGFIYGIDAAHVRYGDLSYGKRETGASEKPDDRWCVPLHRSIHEDQHKHGERDWWIQIGIDPLRIACALWGASGDEEAGRLIIANARANRAAHSKGEGTRDAS